VISGRQLHETVFFARRPASILAWKAAFSSSDNSRLARAFLNVLFLLLESEMLVNPAARVSMVTVSFQAGSNWAQRPYNSSNASKSSQYQQLVLGP